MSAVFEKKLELLVEEIDYFCKLVFSPAKDYTKLVPKSDWISSNTNTVQVVGCYVTIKK